MLMPSIGSISGAIHLAARKPYVIAIIFVLTVLVVASTAPTSQDLFTQWIKVH